MVFQIEHARESCPRELILVPRAVFILMLDEPRDGSLHGGIIRPLHGQQADQAPSRLRSGALSNPLETRIIVGSASLAETSVGVLHTAKPVGGAPAPSAFRKIKCFSRPQHSARPVHVI